MHPMATSVMESLQLKYRFAEPPAGLTAEATFGPDYADYWNAELAARATVGSLEHVAQEYVNRNEKPGHGRLGAPQWNTNRTFRLGAQAFQLARAAKAANVRAPDDVVHHYTDAVAASSGPDFFDKLADFRDKVYYTANGKAVTGGEMLREATKALYPGNSGREGRRG